MTLWNTQQEDLDAIARSTQWADEPEAPEPYPEPATVEGEEPESASETVPAADAPVEPTANIATVPKPKEAVPVVAKPAAPTGWAPAASPRGCGAPHSPFTGRTMTTTPMKALPSFVEALTDAGLNGLLDRSRA